MPRTRSLAWSELKIGMLTVFALVIAAATIFIVGGENMFAESYPLKTRFGDIRGLKEGAVVRVAGVEVGKVTEIAFAGASVEVSMEIREEMRDKIRTESRASIGALSLLGEPVIDITPTTQGQPLPDWGFVQTARSSGQLADVAESATRSLEETTALIRDVRQGRGTVGKLFTDEALYREIQQFVDSAAAVAANLQRGRGTIGALMNDRAAYQALEGSLRNLQAVTGRINAGEGTLGRFLKDEALAKSLTSASTSLDAVAGKVNRGEGTAGRLVNDPQLYNRLNEMAGRLEDLVGRLNQGEGTAGQLLRDRQLYENMNAAAGELRSLVADIRKDPRKYLNVRVSIF